MLKTTIDTYYHNQILQNVIEEEKSAIAAEWDQKSFRDIYMDRMFNGSKGLGNMTTSELEAHIDIDPEYATDSYLRIFVDTITKQQNSAQLDFLLRLLADKNIQMVKHSPRKLALMNHLKEVAPNEKYKQIKEICPEDDTVFLVEDEKGRVNYFKVYTEQECIDELVDWYESDFTSYTFAVEEIADILSMSNETVLALDLLNNVTDCLVGDGTEQLLNLLKKMNRLKDLAANAKENSFMLLAEDNYAYKSGDYYILEEYNYYEGVAANV